MLLGTKNAQRQKPHPKKKAKIAEVKLDASLILTCSETNKPSFDKCLYPYFVSCFNVNYG